MYFSFSFLLVFSQRYFCVEEIVYKCYAKAVRTTLLSASLCRDAMSKTFYLRYITNTNASLYKRWKIT